MVSRTAIAIVLAVIVVAVAIAASGKLGSIISPATPTPVLPVSATPAPTTPTPTPGPYRVCPMDCSDGNPCTADSCSARTGFQCAHDPLNGQYPGCTEETGTCTAYSCVDGVCSNVPVKPCCGNGVCEQGETCECSDCACSAGRACCAKACVIPTCSSDADCPDANACTADACMNPGTCTAACTHVNKTCAHADGCCGNGCDYVTDNDCPAYSKGQTARAGNLSLSADALYLRTCYRTTTSKEENWLALRLTISNLTAVAYFEPNMTMLIDPFWRMNLTSTSPDGTDCFDRDREYLLPAGPVTGERQWLAYFKYGERAIIQQGKTVVVTLDDGSRVVWLITPSG